MNLGVLGAGAWGCALGKVLHDNGHHVTMWGRNPALLEQIKTSGENTRYLPGIPLGCDWDLTSDLSVAASGQDALVMAVPSGGFRPVAEQVASFQGVVVSVTKGIEFESGKTMTEVLADSMGITLERPSMPESGADGGSVLLHAARNACLERPRGAARANAQRDLTMPLCQPPQQDSAGVRVAKQEILLVARGEKGAERAALARRWAPSYGWRPRCTREPFLSRCCRACKSHASLGYG